MRYRWPRGAKGRLHLKGTPAQIVTDPDGTRRTVPGHNAMVARFGAPDFPPNIFETNDPWMNRAIQAHDLFQRRQIILDDGKPLPPVGDGPTLAAATMAEIVALRLGSALPDEEPEWGALSLADLEPVAGLSF